MGWMNDTLDYLRFIHMIESSIIINYLFYDVFYNEHYLLPFSHDEVVHGKATILQKMWGEYDLKFQQGKRLSILICIRILEKKLNFMGNENWTIQRVG